MFFVWLLSFFEGGGGGGGVGGEALEECDDGAA